MKNLYLFGHSDDCSEVESDCGVSHESYGDIIINGVLFRYVFDGDWGIYPDSPSAIPETWTVFPIESNTAVEVRRKELGGACLHIQIPEVEPVSVSDADSDDE